ncbi:glycosyltransferase [Microbacterium sp. RU33B]|uniref:glycosyltransferase n=1 Tax=Microbacterium sp. RU33B TaxID=1907390 RepID=UPI0015C36839|nr:glycosyltransferase [Microbacterium sp. RU33B]
MGAVLSFASFAAVVSMPELAWEADRGAELRATYETYHETGVLLVKQIDTGSPRTQSAAASDPGSDRVELIAAAWNDDTGAYLAASLMGHLTGSTSPYPGLSLLMAILVATPLLWLPTSVARIFRRARAGYALILLPAAMWLLNQGTILVGTEYGLSDSVSTLRVHAFYGVAASLAFLSLALILHLSTYRLSWTRVIVASAGLVFIAGLGNVTKSFSGVGVAIAVGVLWWLMVNDRLRWVRALAAAVVAVSLSVGIQTAVTTLVDAGRSSAILTTSAETPDFHGTWQQLYLGLSHPQSITGEPSVFEISPDPEETRELVAEVAPEVTVGSAEYDAILRDAYFTAISAEPLDAVGLYLAKALYVIKQFGAMIAFIIVAYVIAMMRRSPQRRLLKASLAIASPTLMVGLASAVLVLPDLYHYAELSAALGLLVTVSLGGLVWSLTSMPSHVRSMERSRLSRRLGARLAPDDVRSHTSVIVPTRNGESVIGDTIDQLAERLRSGDEIIVVENGSTDRTTAVLEDLEGSWSHGCALVVLHSGAGLGEALRTGVLASSGQWLLLTADDLPFGFSDLQEFNKLSADTVVAVGSKAHPESEVVRSSRRVIQSRVFRFLRAALLQSRVGDSQGTIWVEGDWARSFALLSREMGLMWTTELVLAAEQQGIRVEEVPVSLSDAHETGSSRFRLADAWASVVGFTRLAVYKDDYANETWTRTTAQLEEEQSRAREGSTRADR